VNIEQGTLHLKFCDAPHGATKHPILVVGEHHQLISRGLELCRRQGAELLAADRKPCLTLQSVR
jgi:hypothetical protein